jgi:hypothetical protein
VGTTQGRVRIEYKPDSCFQQAYGKFESSCSAILKKNPKAKSNKYWIRAPNNDVVKVFCDMETQKGGWTAVSEVDMKQKGKMPELLIDDLGLKYTQVLYQACPSTTLDYEYKESTDWVSHGYNIHLNYLGFSGKRYRVKPPVARWTIPAGNVWTVKKKFNILLKPKSCKFEGEESQTCALKFIYDVPKGKKLDKFGDIESLTGETAANNYFDYHFKILVR